MSDSSQTSVQDTKVVIAIDGSVQAEQCFQWYVNNVHKQGNYVILCHAQELPALPTRESYESQMKVGKQKWTVLQDKFMQLFTEKKISGKFVADFEKPGEFICKTAKAEEAAYIVMGTRGLGKIRRTIMGSVSDYVVHHAICPVLVCRNKD